MNPPNPKMQSTPVINSAWIVVTHNQLHKLLTDAYRKKDLPIEKWLALTGNQITVAGRHTLSVKRYLLLEDLPQPDEGRLTLSLQRSMDAAVYGSIKRVVLEELGPRFPGDPLTDFIEELHSTLTAANIADMRKLAAEFATESVRQAVAKLDAKK